MTLGAALQPLACGPSVQLIYEGNIRFEHCYRLDFDEHIAPSHRRACWSEWVARYSQGQTRDRLEYGRRRIESIDRGEGATLTLRLQDAVDAGAPPAIAEPPPVPTSLHAPPPALIPVAIPSSPADSGTAGARGVGGADAGAISPVKIKGNPETVPGSRRGKQTKS